MPLSVVIILLCSFLISVDYFRTFYIYAIIHYLAHIWLLFLISYEYLWLYG